MCLPQHGDDLLELQPGGDVQRRLSVLERKRRDKKKEREKIIRLKEADSCRGEFVDVRYSGRLFWRFSPAAEGPDADFSSDRRNEEPCFPSARKTHSN